MSKIYIMETLDYVNINKLIQLLISNGIDLNPQTNILTFILALYTGQNRHAKYDNSET